MCHFKDSKVDGVNYYSHVIRVFVLYKSLTLDNNLAYLPKCHIQLQTIP